VHGVRRPKIETNEGETPALGDHQAKALLEAPDSDTLKGLRNRAILAVLLHHGLRRVMSETLRSGVASSTCRSTAVATVGLADRQGQILDSAALRAFLRSAKLIESAR